MSKHTPGLWKVAGGPALLGQEQYPYEFPLWRWEEQEERDFYAC